MRKILIVLVLAIFSFSVMAQEKKEQAKPEKVKKEKVEKKAEKKAEKTVEKKEAVKTEPKPEKKVEKETPAPQKDITEKKEEEKKEEEKKEEVKPEEKAQPVEVVKTEKDPEPVKKIEETPQKDLNTLAKELEDLKAEITKMKEEKKEEKKAAAKKDEKLSGDPIMFKPYGFVELYGWANDAQFLSNDLVIYVKDEKGSTASLSARNTRLGFEVSVPYIKTVDLSAKLEIDFFGSLPDSGTAVTSTGIRMRHAYLKLAKTFESGTTLALIAGQTWATATIPVFPNLINPAAGWGIGNPWTRIPLVELTVAQKMGKLCTGLKLAAAKPISGTSSNRNGFIEVNVDSGDVSHWPSLQGQFFLNGKFDKISFNFAAAGAYGREDYTNGIKMNNSDTIYGDEVHTWIFNTALVFSHKYASIKGKFYIGENLDMFGVFGGSLIKENGIVRDSLRAMGYWAELSLMPFGGLVLSTGLGAEMPEDVIDAKYKKNDAFWVAAYYTFVKHFRVGLQWQNTSTEYADPVGKQTGNSFMGSLRFTF